MTSLQRHGNCLFDQDSLTPLECQWACCALEVIQNKLHKPGVSEIVPGSLRACPSFGLPPPAASAFRRVAESSAGTQFDKMYNIGPVDIWIGFNYMLVPQPQPRQAPDSYLLLDAITAFLGRSLDDFLPKSSTRPQRDPLDPINFNALVRAQMRREGIKC